MSRRGDQGFTLIEALVAMVILAVGALSLLAATEGHAVRIGQVIDRAAARWAAEHRLAELRLSVEPTPGPVAFYGRRFDLAVEARPTDDPGLLRVDVAAAAEGGPTLVTLTGYVAVPGAVSGPDADPADAGGGG